jgi:hypothetical protein
MSFFQRLKSNPKAEKDFNQALDVYNHLRRYPVHSFQYRQQLKQIAISCRSAISLNDRHGDAQVLLANTYLLMFIESVPQVGDCLSLKLAAAVIQHWADEPLRQYPWTKFVENGQKIHSQVADTIRTFLSDQGHSVQSLMEGLKATYYADAILRDCVVWME